MPTDPLQFLPVGYLLTVLIETPILIVGLSKPHPLRRRVFAGLWLTACTYPIVVLVLPVLLEDYEWVVYVLVAETFAPAAECLLFFAAFGTKTDSRRQRLRDAAAITIANLTSFGLGRWILSLVGAE